MLFFIGVRALGRIKTNPNYSTVTLHIKPLTQSNCLWMSHMKQFTKVDHHQQLLLIGSLKSGVLKIETCFFMWYFDLSFSWNCLIMIFLTFPVNLTGIYQFTGKLGGHWLLHIHINNVRGGSSIGGDVKATDSATQVSCFTHLHKEKEMFYRLYFCIPTCLYTLPSILAEILVLVWGKMEFKYIDNLFKILLVMYICKWHFEILGHILTEGRTVNLHTHISAIQEETVRPPKPGKKKEVK